MLQCKPAKTTLPSNLQLIPATTEEFEEARHLKYPAMVGSIMYAAIITRPDIAQAAGTKPKFTQHNISFDISEVPWTCVLHSTQCPERGSCWDLLMPTGAVVLTHRDQPQATSFKPLEER